MIPYVTAKTNAAIKTAHKLEKKPALEDSTCFFNDARRWLVVCRLCSTISPALFSRVASEASPE